MMDGRLTDDCDLTKTSHQFTFAKNYLGPCLFFVVNYSQSYIIEVDSRRKPFGWLMKRHEAKTLRKYFIFMIL